MEETIIGNAYWQPESSISQSKITAYWESQMNPTLLQPNSRKQNGAKSPPNQRVSDNFEEGNHCFVQKDTRPGSGESGEKRF